MWRLSVIVALLGVLSTQAALPKPDFCGGYHLRPGLLQAYATVPTTGTNHLLVIRARMTDDPPEPFLSSQIAKALAEANKLFLTNSYGKFSLTWTITPMVDLPRSHADYENLGFYTFLDDAHAAAKKAGYNPADYDLDLTRHTAVSGWREGEANIGSAGARVASDSVPVIVHEIGHNLGLFHANFWNTGAPDFATYASPPFPSNLREMPGYEQIAFDPDSLYGHETTTGPGQTEEYGDLFDLMGYGQERFNAFYRRLLNWLPESAVAAPTHGTIRLYALHSNSVTEGVNYALRIPAESAGQDFWFQYNPGLTPWIDNGVQMHWCSPGVPSTLLLDASPGTILHRDDSALEIGRTFSDPARGFHITPLQLGKDEKGPWIELALRLDVSETNSSPVLTLHPAKTQLNIDEPVEIIAEVSDPDGDPLAYHWIVDDGTPSVNTNRLTGIYWKEPGDHVILCEVSDLRGGVTTAHVVLRVGTPRTLRISGRVLDENGSPVRNVRVHNDRSGRGYLGTFTDSAGAYTLTGLIPGNYTNNAFLYGYRIERANFTWPVTLENSSLSNINFVARTVPQVSVRLPARAEEGSVPLLEFTRSGSIDQPLTITFGLSGTAQPNRDYSGFLITTATFPAGAAQVSLPLMIFDDTLAESNETVTVEVIFPGTEVHHRGQPNEYTAYYPGWELRNVLGTDLWFQTDPAYLPDRNSATLIIVDNDHPREHTVSIHAPDAPAIERPLRETAFTLFRSGLTNLPLTVFYRLGGNASEFADFVPIPNSSPGSEARSVRFESGVAELEIPVIPIDDGLEEGSESATFEILPDDVYAIDVASATISIQDNETAPVSMTLQIAANGELLLQIYGRAGKVHVLEESTNLTAWTELRRTVLFQSPWVVSLPRSGDGTPRFFRVFQP